MAKCSLFAGAIWHDARHAAAMGPPRTTEDHVTGG